MMIMNLQEWQDKGKPLNSIVNCDCLEGLKLLADNSVDCIVTSPPYNKNGFRNGKKDPGKSSSRYKRWDGAKIDYDSYTEYNNKMKYIGEHIYHPRYLFQD